MCLPAEITPQRKRKYSVTVTYYYVFSFSSIIQHFPPSSPLLHYPRTSPSCHCQWPLHHESGRHCFRIEMEESPHRIYRFHCIFVADIFFFSLIPFLEWFVLLYLFNVLFWKVESLINVPFGSRFGWNFFNWFWYIYILLSCVSVIRAAVCALTFVIPLQCSTIFRGH